METDFCSTACSSGSYVHLPRVSAACTQASLFVPWEVMIYLLHRKQAADDYYGDRLLQHSLRQWQLCTKWSRDTGWKEELAFDHRAGGLLLKSMQGWHMVCL